MFIINIMVILSRGRDPCVMQHAEGT